MSEDMIRQDDSSLPAKALRGIEGRLRARFRAFLRPGERIRLRVEEEKDFSFAHLVLSSADKSYVLDLEGAVILHDQEEAVVISENSRDRLLLAIEFLSATLNDHFRGNRLDRFHPDWRLYTFEGYQVRFRGRNRSPGLEAQANALLEANEEEKEIDE